MKALLVVEDNRSLRESMARALRSPVDGLPGFLVHVASDCDEAIAVATDNPLDAAIVDYHLPPCGWPPVPCNGVVLLGHLRRLRPGLPVALLTGMLPLEPEVFSADFTIGPVEKPIDRDELVALARRLTT
jgi:DNA-binding NtrC family response regulator